MESLKILGLSPKHIIRNPSPEQLYKDAVDFDGSQIAESGVLVSYSGEKTGRVPKSKRILRNSKSEEDVWWGDVNIPISEEAFLENRSHAISELSSCERLYVIDAFAGWNKSLRKKIRVVCSRPYHALFMHNMLIRPTEEELENFGEADYLILNAGFAKPKANFTDVGSDSLVALSFERKELVILGTEYAGEMKKGVFTIMNYILPKQNVLSMHCSANEGEKEDVTLFFGLSGTGKTTLSADPKRRLIGDDEHGWDDSGVFNIEGGCYAKCAGLSAESEPEIFNALRFGSLLENVQFFNGTQKINFSDISVTENTRASYPIEHIGRAKIPCEGPAPKNIIFLTCDAFGVLPPVSHLSPEQAMYHFISGYTAKVAGTEDGVKEPSATFSACFGAAFMVWHPSFYAELLAQKMRASGAKAWLVNTGWIGGAYGVGKRISLRQTRAIIDAIHSPQSATFDYVVDPYFGLSVPKIVEGVDESTLLPWRSWTSESAYRKQAVQLAELFRRNFENYAPQCTEGLLAAGPELLS